MLYIFIIFFFSHIIDLFLCFLICSACFFSYYVYYYVQYIKVHFLYVKTYFALNLNSDLIQEVVVDFEAHTISGNDYNGIKKLLQQVWDIIYNL